MNPKDVIAPLQKWLLSRDRCVGCGRSLEKKGERKENGIILVTCECQRVFVYEPEESSYRRALFHEADILKADISG